MTVLPRLLRAAPLLALAPGLLAAPAAAQRPAPDTVPFIPTPPAVVSAMLALGRVGAQDVVYDLGSGDGRIVLAAARERGARAVGYEIDPSLVRSSRARAEATGVGHLAGFRQQDLFEAELAAASVVMLYLSPQVNLQLRPRLLRELAPGARVVSHTFHMGDWEPDSTVTIGEGFGRATIRLWTVPAVVDGFWQLELDTPGGPRRLVLELAQRYQALQGAARGAGAEIPIAEGEMEGERITLLLREGAGTHRLEGRWTGAGLEGVYLPAGGRALLGWRARRFTP